jgi:hypothetical protein
MQLKLNKDTPGPGAYRPPSDFGYVDSMKSPRTQQSPRSSMTGNNFLTSRSKNYDGAATANGP